MMFWEVRFKYEIIPDNPFACEPGLETTDPVYFKTMEECMAYVIAQKHLNIKEISLTQRSLGTWKAPYLLNDPDNEKEVIK